MIATAMEGNTKPQTSFNAAELLDMEFPEPRFAVPGIIPEGLTLFNGRPKIGKSWFCLDIALAVALGRRALGKIQVEAGNVLYLALEDPGRAIKRRLKKRLGDTHPSGIERLQIETAWERWDNGGAERFDARLAGGDFRLAIIDTFKKVRKPKTGRGESYQEDYDAVDCIRAPSIKHNVPTLLVHHVRKADADDPMDMVSGTNGLTAASDSIMVVTRARIQEFSELFVVGRDLEERELGLRFNQERCEWTLEGDADAARLRSESREIIEVLTVAKKPLTAKEIAAALDKKDGTIKTRLSRMAKRDEISHGDDGYSLCVPVTW